MIHGSAWRLCWKFCRRRIKLAYEKAKDRYILRRRYEKFTVDQKVWKRRHVLSDAIFAKFAPKFEGPFLISKIVSPWTRVI